MKFIKTLWARIIGNIDLLIFRSILDKITADEKTVKDEILAQHNKNMRGGK